MLESPPMKSVIPSSSLRVIGGKWRSRKLKFPALPGLRPTADRIRETLFNWLREDIDCEACLDLFAGSGACGTEALSRGASRAVFVESHPRAAAAITDNLELLGAQQAEVICQDAMAWLKAPADRYHNSFGIAFIDPPYALALARPAAIQLENSGVLKAPAKVYIESDRPLDPAEFPKNWEVLRHKKAGIVNYYLFLRKAPLS